jgi:hypothetical protein
VGALFCAGILECRTARNKYGSAWYTCVLQRGGGQFVIDWRERGETPKRQYYCLFLLFKLGDTIHDSI